MFLKAKFIEIFSNLSNISREENKLDTWDLDID